MSEAATTQGGVYDEFEKIRQILIERCGENVADLFARPVVTRGNGAAPTSVSWYSRRTGNIQPWAQLDFDTRGRISDDLVAMFERLKPVLADESLCEILLRWLNLPRLDGNLFVIGNAPVLINWGQLPVSAVESPKDRYELFEQALGQFASWAPVPPFHPTDAARIEFAESAAATDEAASAVPGPAGVAPGPASTGPTGTGPAAAGAGAAAVGAAAPLAVAAVQDNRCCRGLVIATIIAAIILLILLIPGVLQYGSGNGFAVSADTRNAAAAVLRQRIADLQDALSHPSCGVDDQVVGNSSIVLPSIAADGAIRYQPDNNRAPIGESSAATQVPPTPQVVNAPATQDANPAAPSATNLVDFLDQATVLIVVRTAQHIATGSGFFVNPTDILTNLHVVEDASAGTIYVVSKALGAPVEASVVASSASSDVGQADMAVLRIAGEAPGPYLKLASDVPRGANVLAFGFPAFVLDSDQQFQCLMASDMHSTDSDCIPFGSVTTGIVTTIQQAENGSSLVLHSATISEGNSGGPLVDYCGRAVGINTFGRRDAERVQQLNFAQHATAISQFLTRNSVRHEVEETGCALVPVTQQADGQTAAPVDDKAPTPEQAVAATPAG